MKKRLLAALALVALMGFGATAALATSGGGGHTAVTLCHRTGSVAGGNQHNGYDLITVDISSVASAKSARGHDGHDQVGNGPGGDIIPVFTYTAVHGPDAGQTFTYPGKNLDFVFANGDTGAQVLAAGCTFSQPEGPTLVSPVAPVFTPASCDNPGSVAIPDEPEGVVVATSVSGNIETVTFSPAEGYAFPDGTQTTYTFDLTSGSPTGGCGGGGGGGGGGGTPPPSGPPAPPVAPVVHPAAPGASVPNTL